jgi:5-methylcytosine-specific restriction protein B
MSQFSWTPFFEEMLTVICQKYEKHSLCQPFHTIFQDFSGRTDQFADGSEGDLREIDPLTFIGYFNRSIQCNKRVECCRMASETFNLTSSLPSDFDGIPFLNNMNTWFFGYARDREDHIIDDLWQFAHALNTDKITDELFHKILSFGGIAIPKLTVIMFVCKPVKYLCLDKKTLNYLEKENIQVPRQNSLRKSLDGFTQYQSFLGTIRSHFNEFSFPEISHQAYLPEDKERFWLIAPGEQARLWEDFKQNKIIAIGCDELGDLTQYSDKETIRKKLQEVDGEDNSKMHDTLACWEFSQVMKPGDYVFAKKGYFHIIGYGKITSEYRYDASRKEYQQTRGVEWLSEGDWELPKGIQLSQKMLTDITDNSGLRDTILSLTTGKPIPQQELNYWWINANPKIWDFSNISVGEKETYTSHNKEGDKRRIYKYFEEVKPEDIVLGYVSTPNMEIVAICKITQGLHETGNGQGIELLKLKQLKNPIKMSELQNIPELKQCEPIRNNQGSLFKLQKAEYEILRHLIDDRNPPEGAEPYLLSEAIQDVFLDDGTFHEILGVLSRKKNIILQGPPGTGKSFIAQRIAYAKIGLKDPTRVETIQFHQSYSYEDFMQGYRPNENGVFDLRNGIFYEFCKKAQRDPDNIYVFIVDEINRGNLSKIFGELMLLIENDKRGPNFAVSLTYAKSMEDRFYIPENLYLIGTMNTADRSLAMVDYALRRRFCFFDLEPQFNHPQFRLYLSKKGVPTDVIDKILDRMGDLNAQIASDTKNLGPCYRIGHSFFCPSKDDILLDSQWYQLIIRHEIAPLIREYWFDEPEKAEEIIKELCS